MLNIEKLIYDNSLDKVEKEKQYDYKKLNFGKYNGVELKEIVKSLEGRRYLFWLAKTWEQEKSLSPTKQAILKFIQNI